MKEYHHGNLRQKLLDEGLKLLKEEGYGAFSLRKLARRCNVSHNSPYRHFSGKEDLIRTLAFSVHDKFNQALKEGVENCRGSGREKVNAMGRAYIRFFLKNPDYLDLLFLIPEVQDLVPEDGEYDADSPFITYLKAVGPFFGLSEEQMSAHCEKREEEIPGAALRPWCLIHGLTVLLAKKAIPLSSDEALDTLISQVLGEE